MKITKFVLEDALV